MGVRVVFPDMGKDPSVQLIEKTITENGTYDAITDGANGYSKVNVNVEGGGGSSDFSTAQVTFNGIGQGDFIDVRFAEALESEDDYPAASFGRNEVSDGTYNIILYKGLAELKIVDLDINATASGAVTTENNLIFDITGDCTITIS